MARLLLCLLIGLAPAWAASPWLPMPGKATLTTLYVNDSFQDYRPGALQRTLPAPYDQTTFYTVFEYGLRNTLALDVETGHTETAFRGNGLSGITDSTIGLRWMAKRGENWVLTLRGAGIIAGNYDISRTANFSPGDKASGGLGSALFGAAWRHGFFNFFEAGYRVRQKPVPQDFFGTAGVGHSWKRFTYTFSYQTSRSINGVDIVGTAPNYSPYFHPSQFPATKKIFGGVDVGASVYLKSGLSLGFNYSKILHGRNVGMKRVIAVTASFTLPGKGPHLH
jgi:hypothetical protein